MAPQTTIAVITVKPWNALTYQSWLSSPNSQFTTPKTGSNSQLKTSVEATCGIAHTQISATTSSIRHQVATARISSAMPVDSSTVSPTAVTVNTTVRIATCQNCGSVRMYA